MTGKGRHVRNTEVDGTARARAVAGRRGLRSLPARAQIVAVRLRRWRRRWRRWQVRVDADSQGTRAGATKTAGEGRSLPSAALAVPLPPSPSHWRWTSAAVENCRGRQRHPPVDCGGNYNINLTSTRLDIILDKLTPLFFVPTLLLVPPAMPPLVVALSLVPPPLSYSRRRCCCRRAIVFVVVIAHLHRHRRHIPLCRCPSRHHRCHHRRTLPSLSSLLSLPVAPLPSSLTSLPVVPSPSSPT